MRGGWPLTPEGEKCSKKVSLPFIEARRLLLLNSRVPPMFLPICHLVPKCRRQTSGDSVLSAFLTAVYALVQSRSGAILPGVQKNRPNGRGTLLLKAFEVTSMRHWGCIAWAQQLTGFVLRLFSFLRRVAFVFFSLLIEGSVLSFLLWAKAISSWRFSISDSPNLFSCRRFNRVS